MKTIFSIIAITMLLVTSSWAATTVKGTKSNSDNRRRVISSVTSTTSLSGPSDTQTVYTTPATSNFILTGLCVTPTVSGGVRLDVAGFGGIAHLGTLGDNGCYTFSEGVLLPRDSAITCSTSAGASPGNYFCTISGLE